MVQQNSPDMPLGLGMALAQSTDALSHFGSLSPAEQARLIGYVQASATGEEAKARIDQVVEQMRSGQ